MPTMEGKVKNRITLLDYKISKTLSRGFKEKLKQFLFENNVFCCCKNWIMVTFKTHTRMLLQMILMKLFPYSAS